MLNFNGYQDSKTTLYWFFIWSHDFFVGGHLWLHNLHDQQVQPHGIDKSFATGGHCRQHLCLTYISSRNRNSRGYYYTAKVMLNQMTLAILNRFYYFFAWDQTYGYIKFQFSYYLFIVPLVSLPQINMIDFGK